MASPKWTRKKQKPAERHVSKLIDDLSASLFTNMCTACGAPSTFNSALGMSWCPEHAYRGKVANWAHSHQFPELRCFPFLISADETHWRFSLAFGSDDLMWSAYAAIECADGSHGVA